MWTDRWRGRLMPEYFSKPLRFRNSNRILRSGVPPPMEWLLHRQTRPPWETHSKTMHVHTKEMNNITISFIEHRHSACAVLEQNITTSLLAYITNDLISGTEKECTIHVNRYCVSSSVLPLKCLKCEATAQGVWKVITWTNRETKWEPPYDIRNGSLGL